MHDAFAFVLVVHACRSTGAHWQRGPRVAQQLLAGLVHTDQRPPRIVGAGVDLQHIFHAPDELAVGLGRDAPLLASGLELVF